MPVDISGYRETFLMWMILECNTVCQESQLEIFGSVIHDHSALTAI